MRIRVLEVNDIEEAITTLGRLPASGTVILDLENTLMPSGGALQVYAASVRELLERIGALPNVTSIRVVTNRSLTNEELAFLPPDTLAGVHKPRVAQLIPSETSILAVVGDQLATDGRLAGRYGAPFIMVGGRDRSLPILSRLHQFLLKACLRAGWGYVRVTEPPSDADSHKSALDDGAGDARLNPHRVVAEESPLPAPQMQSQSSGYSPTSPDQVLRTEHPRPPATDNTMSVVRRPLPPLMGDERARVWAHLEAMYARESSLYTAVATVGIIGVALTQFSRQALLERSGDSSTGHFEAFFELMGVIGPVIILGLFLYLYLLSRITGFYIRRLEAALRVAPTHTTPALIEYEPQRFLRVPFYGALMSAAFARVPGRRGGGIYRIFLGIITWGVALLLGLGSLTLALTVGDGWGMFRYSVVGAVCLLLAMYFAFFALASARGSAARLVLAAKAVEEERRSGLGDRRASTTWMTRKLLLPRPASLTKGLWIMFGAAYGLAVTGFQPRAGQWMDLALLVLILEFVLAQGRYLLNDLRDVDTDQSSADPTIRSRSDRRLSDVQYAILAASISVRFAIALLLVPVMTVDVQQPVFWWIVTLVVSTVLYEYGRDRSRPRVNAQEQPAGLLASEVGSRVLDRWIIFTTVPMGYVIRVGSALWVVGAPDRGLGVVFAVLLATYFANWAMVRMGWLLSAMDALGVPTAAGTRDGRQVGPSKEYAPSLYCKPHVLWLTLRAGLLAEDARPVGAVSGFGHGRRGERPLTTSPDFRDWVRRTVYWPSVTSTVMIIVVTLYAMWGTPWRSGGFLFVSVLLTARSIRFKYWIKSSMKGSQGDERHAEQVRKEWPRVRPSRLPRPARFLGACVTVAGLIVALLLWGVTVGVLPSPDVTMDHSTRVLSFLARFQESAQELLAGMAAAGLVHAIYGGTRGTATISLSNLRMYGHHVARSFLNLLRGLVAGAVGVFVGSNRTMAQSGGTSSILERGNMGRVRRLEDAVELSWLLKYDIAIRAADGLGIPFQESWRLRPWDSREPSSPAIP